MAAGYSKKSLAEKLGIKEGARVAVINPPLNYCDILGPLPRNVESRKGLEGPLEVIQFFTRQRAELENEFPRLKKALAPAGALWVCWPKGSSNVMTDLTENVVREVGLENRLVDVKVCAVDEVWSGLKFVFRVKDRK